MSVYLKKQAQALAEPEAKTTTPAMQRGHLIELSLLNHYKQHHAKGYRTRRGPAYEATPLRRGWAVARPDLMVLHRDTRRVVRVMDAKTTRDLSADRGWGPDGSGQVPAHYLAQLVWQAYVCDVRSVALVVFCALTDEHRTYHVELPQSAIDSTVRAVETWRTRHLLPWEPPPVDGSSAWADYLRDTYKAPEAPRWRDLDDEARELLSELRRAKADAKDAKARADLASNRLKALLDGYTGYRSGEEVIARVSLSKPRETLDTKGLRAAHPDIASRFTKTGKPTLSLRITGEEDE